MTKIHRRAILAAALYAVLLLAAHDRLVAGEDKFIIVQSTTSTQNSGLFEHILPIFTKKTGIEVRVVAVGTGQALKNAANGDGDVVLVHSKPDEEKFVADGWGVKRYDVMYNDFIIVGPAADPAKIAGLKDAAQAFKQIAAAKAPFASRADDSGTNKAEIKLWQAAGVDAKAASGSWYLETGSGMGATLNFAVGKEAYTLTDRGTWLSFANKSDFKVLVEGDPKLFNQYGVILVNPAKHPNVKVKEGQAFIDWLIGPEGQAAIASYKIDGQQLFFPNAGPPS
ncbi:substrate-binding domain-containing protein [Methyloceanibacter sp.]|uniref:substrate-binding domain-containing protein n=1 Tax=Methyloceanibacter sp. TaxID=1965321 RepID=UPI002D4D23AF|nr:substrate-binding domain-containing protein [Methyloceanibacter sp.]HZP09731.1 substrate-binding domain-containing protein [Methyloceanibacter sp.]